MVWFMVERVGSYCNYGLKQRPAVTDASSDRSRGTALVTTAARARFAPVFRRLTGSQAYC
jgi:hypothetical protein